MTDWREPSLQHVLPYSNEAERAVLGAILLRNECITVIVDFLDREDFAVEAHRIIYQTMLEVYERDNKVDLVLLKEELRRLELLDAIGGVAYLSGLLDAVPTAANVEQHSKIIQEKSILRKLINTADKLLQRSYQDTEPVDDLLSDTEAELLKLSERRFSQSIVPLSKIIGPTFKEIENLFERRELIAGLPTGFADLDNLSSGLHAGDLIILAGRPSMGKTTLGVNIAHNIALNHKIPTAIFSLEMSREQLVMRLLAAEAGVDGHRLRNGFLKKEDWPKLTQALGRLSKAPIYIDDTPSLTPFRIRAKARRLQASANIKLVVIDYLQLMQGDRDYNNRQQEISDISRAMKSMAKELNIPVVALSQLSRAVESRDRKKRPQLSDLRESGAIEQDADLVMFLYRPEVYGIKTMETRDGVEEPTDGKAELIIAKHRNGPIGSCFLAFLKQYLLFKNLGHAREGAVPEEVLLTGEEDSFPP